MPAPTRVRFVAAFAVLRLHCRDPLGPMPAWLRQGSVCGRYGVTLFVMLSGFILTCHHHGWFAACVGDAGFWQFQRLRMAGVDPVRVPGLLLDTVTRDRAHAGWATGGPGASRADVPGLVTAPAWWACTRWSAAA
ncbi:MAG: hypothetical protein H7306_25450 [Bacteriovorax sp.]|nr:hypothetical protein [Rhizobacter sp.]